MRLPFNFPKMKKQKIEVNPNNAVLYELYGRNSDGILQSTFRLILTELAFTRISHFGYGAGKTKANMVSGSLHIVEKNNVSSISLCGAVNINTDTITDQLAIDYRHNLFLLSKTICPKCGLAFRRNNPRLTYRELK